METHGDTSGQPSGRLIDPSKLRAWIDMNTVKGQNPAPGAAFIYVDDLLQGLTGFVDADDDSSSSTA